MVSTVFFSTDDTDGTYARIFNEREKKSLVGVSHTQTDAEIRDEMRRKMT